MLKMSVSPLAIRNSSMPNSTPLSVEIKMSSSTSFSAALRVSASARAIHLAARRQHRVGGVQPGDDAPAPAGLLLVERLLVAALAERGDIHGLEELVIVLAHEPLAAVEDLELHAFELGRDLRRLERFRLVDGRREHAHLVGDARIEQPDVVLGTKRPLEFLRGLMRDIRVPLGDLEYAVIDTALLDGGRPARSGG